MCKDVSKRRTYNPLAMQQYADMNTIDWCNYCIQFKVSVPL